MARKSSVDALTLFDALVYTRIYRVSIDLPSDGLAWVMQVRHALRDRVGGFECFYRLPGITLLEVELPPEYGAPLRECIERALAGQRGFALRLDGARHAEDRRSIFLGAEPAAAIGALQQRLLAHVKANRRIRKLGVEAPSPAVALIAGSLKPGQFEAAWQLMGKEAYAGVREVRDLTLLAREVADDSLDEHVRSFRLEY
ncbi:MAG: 2'-5' RNA ligase family protein [Flavobacteriales bacterium]